MARRIIGIDEVGRGSWAGPVVAGAVIMNRSTEGLKDSKKLTANKRRALDLEIRKNAKIGLGWVYSSEIDQAGLTKAVKKAMHLAYQNLGEPADEVIVDGNINYLPSIRGSRAVIGAEDKFKAVAAASIVAKVARDAYMVEVSKKHPDYGFEKHVGYGTAAHKSALKKLGATPIHRRSFKPVAKIVQSR